VSHVWSYPDADEHTAEARFCPQGKPDTLLIESVQQIAWALEEFEETVERVHRFREQALGLHRIQHQFGPPSGDHCVVVLRGLVDVELW